MGLLSFIIGLPREVATDPIATISLPRFIPIINDTVGGWNETNQTIPNWTSATYNTLMVYPDFMGATAIMIIALIPFSMLWISHGNAKMASIIACITIGFLGAFIGGGILAMAVVVIGAVLTAHLMGVFK